MDSKSSDFAKSKLNLETVINKPIDAFFKSNTKKYDLIVFRHVIEHLKYPVETIKNNSGLLDEDGVLILETTNSASYEASIHFGLLRSFYRNISSDYHLSFLSFILNRIFHLRPPIHLFIFSSSNLKTLLSSNSLTVRKSFTYSHHDSIFWQNKLRKHSFIKSVVLNKLKENMNLLIVAQKK